MLVRDETYPLRPFIRSRNIDGPDADKDDPELILDCGDTSKCRCSGSGGTSGTSVYDDSPPRVSGNGFAIERRVFAERDLAAGVSR